VAFFEDAEVQSIRRQKEKTGNPKIYEKKKASRSLGALFF
jgi:hypothetical protein